MRVKLGSAVCIGQKDGLWWFLTVGHNYELERGWRYLGTSVGINNRWHKARFRFGDVSGVDLALVSAAYAGPVKCVSLAEVVPPNGTDVELVGYPKHRGRRRHFATIVSNSLRVPRLTINVSSIEGDSGGGVFFGGELIGIIAETDETVTYANTLSDLKHFVNQKLSSMPVCGSPTEIAPRPPKEDDPPRPQHPEFDPTSLQNRIGALRRRIAELEARLPEKGDKGEQGTKGLTGDTGPQGEPGEQGMEGLIKVEVYRNGKLDETITGVRSGSTVRVKISDKEK